MTKRRCGLATAGTALIPLAALLALAAAAPALAWEPDDRREGRSGERRGLPAALELPGRLLRHSRESFQKMMRRLAERSAGLHPPFVPDPPPPGPGRPKRDWPAAPPDDQEQDWPWPVEPPRDRPDRRRHTVEADDDRPRRQVRDWHKTWSHSCRRAGRPVQGAGWYVVAPGDTLQRIAWLHYGDEGAWRRILHVNGGTISDPDMIYACKRLFIPRRHTDRPRDWPQCEKPPHDPVRPVCDRPPPRPVHRGPGGCSRCGAGAHDGAHGGDWGWR